MPKPSTGSSSTRAPSPRPAGLRPGSAAQDELPPFSHPKPRLTQKWSLKRASRMLLLLLPLPPAPSQLGSARLSPAWPRPARGQPQGFGLESRDGGRAPRGVLSAQPGPTQVGRVFWGGFWGAQPAPSPGEVSLLEVSNLWSWNSDGG